MTTPNEAHAAINDRFITQWADATPFTFTNEGTLADSVDTAWVMVTVHPTKGGQHTLGKKTQRRYRRNGLIMAQVFTPVNTGSQQAETLAKQLGDIFEGESFDGVDCFNANMRNNGSDGEWFQMNVDVEFSYQENK